MPASLLRLFNAITPLEPAEEFLIASSFRRLTLRKGAYFLKAGNVDRHIGFIEKGLVRYFVYKNDQEATFEFSREGDFIADYQSFSKRIPSIQTIEAIEDCELLVIGYDEVQKIFSSTRHGNLLGRIIIEQRFDVMVSQLLSIYMHNAEERYKNFIASYADLSGRIPQYFIASYVGVQPQSLSRMRRRFSRGIS